MLVSVAVVAVSRIAVAVLVGPVTLEVLVMGVVAVVNVVVQDSVALGIKVMFPPPQAQHAVKHVWPRFAESENVPHE